jgi:uncharacterized protein YprB with RNaseH-like and TPR domain
LKHPRIVFYDIETTQLDAEMGHMLTAAWKELGSSKVHSVSIHQSPNYDRDRTNDKYVVEKLAEALLGADIIVGHYSKNFDFPFIQTRLIEHKLPTLPQLPHIDTWGIARKHLKMKSNRLDRLGTFLGAKAEKTYLNLKIWKKAEAGHLPSLRYILKHNVADIELLEEVYLRLRPLLASHPKLNAFLSNRHACPTCGEARLQKRGKQLALKRIVQRYHCQACGAWTTENSLK